MTLKALKALNARSFSFSSVERGSDDDQIAGTFDHDDRTFFWHGEGHAKFLHLLVAVDPAQIDTDSEDADAVLDTAAKRVYDALQQRSQG